MLCVKQNGSSLLLYVLTDVSVAMVEVFSDYEYLAHICFHLFIERWFISSCFAGVKNCCLVLLSYHYSDLTCPSLLLSITNLYIWQCFWTICSFVKFLRSLSLKSLLNEKLKPNKKSSRYDNFMKTTPRESIKNLIIINQKSKKRKIE